MAISKSRREITKADMERAQIGAALWQASFDRIPDGLDHEIDVGMFIRDVRVMISKGLGLLLWGDYSQGKSACAAMCCKEVIGRGGTALFIYTDDVKDFYIDRIPFDDDQTMVQRMESVDLLVLDNMGEEPEKDYSQGRLIKILRKRTDRVKSTIVTTNLNSEELAERYGQKAMQIMIPSMKPVKVAGKNWREERARHIQAWFSRQNSQAT